MLDQIPNTHYLGSKLQNLVAMSKPKVVIGQTPGSKEATQSIFPSVEE